MYVSRLIDGSEILFGDLGKERERSIYKLATGVLSKKPWGLGIHSARELNQAFLMKLAWGFMKRPEDLLVKVLVTKYMKKDRNRLNPRKNKSPSACWSGINDAWPTFTKGLYWGIQNGRRTNFWRESLIDDDNVLADNTNSPAGTKYMSVADACTRDDN
ncbi:hypothetical protein LINPERHAP2_LOCUS11855 [Linum perenne]